MKFLKNLSTTTTTLLATSLCLLLHACHDPSYQRLQNAEASLGVGPSYVFFSPDGGMLDAVVSLLEGANESIDIAMYGITDKRTIAAIIEAARRGIDVRLILDNAKNCGNPCEQMYRAGVNIRYVTPTMHHKFVLVDSTREPVMQSNAILATGSANWSPISDQKYDEAWMHFHAPSPFIEAFVDEFAFLWSNSRSFPEPQLESMQLYEGSRPNWQNVFFTSHNFTPFGDSGLRSFRVDRSLNTVASNLVEAINNPEVKTIKIATTRFRREDLFEALMAALNGGVQVQLILDGQEFRGGPILSESKLHMDQRLASAGADVRYKYYMFRWNFFQAQQMHMKYMIVNDAVVYSGSYNWSDNAENGSFENVQVISERDMVNAYVSNFETIYEYGDGDPTQLVNALRRSRGQQPKYFEPLTLSGRQICILWKEYTPYKRRICEAH
jgi:phosphatidylserine/phosphatidylglycerophosphate/cardiolipin synthase-like enzyme